MNLTAIGLLALQSVAAPDMAAQTRHVLRWYSKTFSTPLHLVEQEIPLEDVWQAFFEEKYEALEPEELEQAVKDALTPPEERAEAEDRLKTEAVADDAFVKATEAAAAAPVPTQVPQILDTALKDTVNPAPKPEPKLEPDILFEFVDDAEMQQLLSKSG